MKGTGVTNLRFGLLDSREGKISQGRCGGYTGAGGPWELSLLRAPHSATHEGVPTSSMSCTPWHHSTLQQAYQGRLLWGKLCARHGGANVPRRISSPPQSSGRQDSPLSEPWESFGLLPALPEETPHRRTCSSERHSAWAPVTQQGAGKNTHFLPPVSSAGLDLQRFLWFNANALSIATYPQLRHPLCLAIQVLLKGYIFSNK